MKNPLLLLGALFTLSQGSVAFALLPAPDKSGIGSPLNYEVDNYRLGDEWGKKAVNPDELVRATPAFRRAALATAHVGLATGFYLGKFHGHHVMATNHHVMPSDSCYMRVAQFPLLNIEAPCETFLGTWEEVDLTLFTVTVRAEDEAKLAPAAGNFLFREDVTAGEKLLTIGFGIAGNPNGELMANQDKDCYVFSPKGEYRLMADPDQVNPGDYRAWSFALGCDVSHGDSGSAIVDRASGGVVGLIWTGRIPKSPAVQSSAFLTQMFAHQDPGIWEELSYAVPSKKIGEVLERELKGELPPGTRAILTDLLKPALARTVPANVPIHP